MNTQASLQHQAINAAKDQNWPAALKLNSTILEQNPTDLGALNRLGVTQIQLGELKAAADTFKLVLKTDKSNSIAKKHLAKLQSNQIPTLPTFSQVYFIEEPGKTKIVELHRLAGKRALDTLTVGQVCEIKHKNRFISIDVKGVYIGALPEDLSFRLSKLIATGNTYDCYVHSFSSNSCTVYIKESFRSAKNQDQHSFPIIKSNLAAINDVDEEFMLEDNIPVEIVETDRDGTERERDLDEEKPFDAMEHRDRDRDRDTE